MTKVSAIAKNAVLFFLFWQGLTFAAAAKNSSDSTGVNTETVYESQTNSEVEMADLLRSNGMIYVVVGVILIVLAGLIIYLVSLDRKVGRMEKEMKERNSRQ